MQSSVRGLLTTSQAAAVLHRSRETVARWARAGQLEVADRVPVGYGDGPYLFDPNVVAEKALELALGKPEGVHQPTLDEACDEG